MRCSFRDAMLTTMFLLLLLLDAGLAQTYTYGPAAPTSIRETRTVTINLNPFNPATVIEFWLPEAGPVVLRVLDMTGREVCRLRDGYAEAGQHTVPVDGSTWSTGTYRYELLHGGRVMTQTMTLLK